jgi:hypothetical protein
MVERETGKPVCFVYIRATGERHEISVCNAVCIALGSRSDGGHGSPARRQQPDCTDQPHHPDQSDQPKHHAELDLAELDDAEFHAAECHHPLSARNHSGPWRSDLRPQAVHADDSATHEALQLRLS